MDSTFERVGESDDYVVTSECALVFSLESNREIALEIAATYRTDFLSAVPFTNDFFDIFKESSLRVIVWPYFRELVQNMMSRMDLPPFVLPITINPVLQGTSQPAHPTSKRKTKAAREGT
ncbi:hypothetical protein IT157_07125 [bacterium]|nr:hypothetical protein [bacterium]